MTQLQRRFLLLCLLGAALAGLLFLPGLHGGFVFDDGPNIVNNRAVHLEKLDADALYQVAFGLQPGGITRVIPTISFALDYWRGGGLHPETFKITNVAIHSLTAFVLAWFFRKLLLVAGLPEKRASLVAPLLALTWAIHPLQVSSVLYVVQRMQTMCTLFMVLALWAYLVGRQAQIQGRSGRISLLLCFMCWVLAFGCKEDAALLPVYTLALELTLFRFKAADQRLARLLSRSYLFATLAGAAAFLLLLIPHYWSWEAYPGRDFSSYERLLTQGRVLCMYLWEILLPLPQHMPFYYDWIQPSRGLLQPWTTLPALLLVCVFLASAWQLRLRKPLFALGVFIFFSGHLITSNVVGLELAFEHRNHFPLIGAVLAVGGLLARAERGPRISSPMGMAACGLLLMLLGGATIQRASTWNSSLSLARASTELAPHSARAWNSLCLYYYDLGGGEAPDNPYLDKAIDVCGKGAAAAPYSVTGQTNLVVFKTKRGNVTQADWDVLLNRLQRVNMGPENLATASVLMYNAKNGVALDETRVLQSMDIISNRAKLGPNEFAAIGNFILTQTQQHERAYAYYARSLEMTSPHDPRSEEIVTELRARGHSDWADKLAPKLHKPQGRQ